MEQGGALLRGIARVLNAGGSALLNIYDAASSLKISALSGEKQKLKGKAREYTKKIERLYYEIGKEVSMQGDVARISAAGEAGVKLVAEYREEIERINQRVEEIEAAERIERQRLLEEREAARKVKSQEATKPVVIPSKKTAPHTEPSVPAASEAPEASAVSTGVAAEETAGIVAGVSEPPIDELPKETSASEEPVASEVLTVAATEEEKEIVAEAAVTDAQETGADTSASAEPEASEVSTDAATEETAGTVAGASETEKEEPHKYTTEELEAMLKRDLLALCTEKGIEVDRRITKAEIVELIVRS